MTLGKSLEQIDIERKRQVELILDSSSYGVYSIRCVSEGMDPMSESMFDMVRGVMSGDIML